jgi:hypothetical protein
MFPSTSCSDITSASILLLMWNTKFGTHTKQQTRLCFVYFNPRVPVLQTERQTTLNWMVAASPDIRLLLDLLLVFVLRFFPHSGYETRTYTLFPMHLLLCKLGRLQSSNIQLHYYWNQLLHIILKYSHQSPVFTTYHFKILINVIPFIFLSSE